MRPDRPLEAELRALITISSTVAGAHRFEDVLDIVGEEACRVLHAAGVSISRWEPDLDLMRTLVNSGELNPGDGAPARRTRPGRSPRSTARSCRRRGRT